MAATTMPSGVHDGCTSVHDGRTTSTAPVATAPGAEEPTLIIPIGIHGDDAGVAAGEKVLVLTWGSLACHGGPRDSRITFSMVKGSEATRGANVQEELYKVLVWSFQCLAAGKYPAEDHTGQPFNAQLRRELAGRALYTLQGHAVGGRFAEMRGDWKFLKESLRLEQHYGRNNVCHRCAAQKRPGVLHYANFGQDAVLRSTRRSHERWAAHQRSRPWCSPLLELPGFNFELVFFDIMHTLDLGVLQVAVPSALYEVTRDQALFAGPTIEARLLTATRQYHDWCDANGIADRAKVLTPKWVQLPHPRVTQLQCKAAAMRSMAYWMRDALYPIRRSSRRALNRWAFFFTSRVPVTSSCAGQAATCEPRSAGPWPTAQRQRSSCTAGSTCGPSRGAWRSGSFCPSCTPGRTLHMTMAAPTPATYTATWTRTWWGARSASMSGATPARRPQRRCCGIFCCSACTGSISLSRCTRGCSPSLRAKPSGDVWPLDGHPQPCRARGLRPRALRECAATWAKSALPGERVAGGVRHVNAVDLLYLVYLKVWR